MDAASMITLEFRDGSSAHCDLLIGADGIYSATRHTLLELAAQEFEADSSIEGKKSANMLRAKKEPVWSGHISYRTTADSEKLRKLNPNHRILSSFQLVCLPNLILHLTNCNPVVCWKREGTVYA